MGVGPVIAVKKAMKANLTAKDIDLIEFNEHSPVK